MAAHINTPVWLDEESPPPHPPRHLLYQVLPAFRVVGSVGVRATQAEKHSFELTATDNLEFSNHLLCMFLNLEEAHVPRKNHADELRYITVFFVVVVVVYKIKVIFIKL